MNDSTNNTATTTTWADVWTVADAAARQTVTESKEWVRENPQTAAAAAAVVGVGIGYLLFG